MSDLMREEFEMWALTSAWIGLGDQTQMDRSEDGTGYNEIEVHTAWLSWQASRESLVVELPKGDSLARRMNGPQACGSNPLISRSGAVEAIRAAGVKTK